MEQLLELLLQEADVRDSVMVLNKKPKSNAEENRSLAAA
jgi:hypothetical protein